MLVRVGLLGYGRVGQAVAAVAERSRARLEAAGVDLQFTGALVRDLLKPRLGPRVRLSRDPASVLSGIDVAVEVLGGIEPARMLIESALAAGVPVVSANKTLVARHGRELSNVAARHGTVFVFDAAVLAGVPFLGSLSRRPLVSHARHLAGIVNGTSQFIVGALDRGVSFEGALAEAVARGYAEPDSSADTSGRDAAEKLAILLHLAGHQDVAAPDLPCTRLEILDPAHLAVARRLGGAIKPVAFASLDPDNPGAWVGPAFVEGDHFFATLGGVANALQITIAADHAVTFAGPGAGPDVTAVTIVDDIVEAVSGGSRPGSVDAVVSGPGGPPLAPITLGHPPAGAWFLGLDGDGATRGRAEQHVSAVRWAEADNCLGVITAVIDWRTVQTSVQALRELGTDVIVLPVIG